MVSAMLVAFGVSRAGAREEGRPPAETQPRNGALDTVDSSHTAVSHSVESAARWVDTFFGGERVDVIRVMCTGRIEPSFILKAFAEGADGVIVSGCHPPGDCHYTNGNFETFRRMPLLEALLAQFGIEKERFHWGWISGAEAPKWAQLARDFTEQVRSLGPLNWNRQLASKED